MRGGRALMATSGASCCCDCPFVYLAELCNPQCVEEYRYKHICGNAICPIQGPYTGPIVPGTVIKEGIRCYRINNPTKYCPPGKTCSRPAYPLLPVRTTAFGEYTCLSDCSLANCPTLGGWYKMEFCSCSESNGVEYYVCCEAYEAALAVTPCPVWSVSRCLYVPPGTQPVPTLPLGASPICGPHQYTDCAECCCETAVAVPPECCRCVSPTVLRRYLGNNGAGTECVTDQTIDPRCWWTARSGGFQGCITRTQKLANGCLASAYCIIYSGLTATMRIWTGPQGGTCNPTQNVSCGACGSLGSMEVLQFDEIPFGPFDPCTKPSGVVPQEFLPNAGNPPPACPIGQTLDSCDQYSVNYFTQGSLVGGHDVRILGTVTKFSPPGTCGNDCGGLVLLDGSPASSVGTIRTGGCTDCGKGQQRTQI